jgi:hypothetical protein
MADNPPAPKRDPLPPLPSSGTTGRLPSPTTHLPVKKGGPGKIVVMLSSVAKPPPAGTQAIPMVAAPKVAPAAPSQVVRRPPPLPPKQVSPGTPKTQSQPQARLSATTYVKLPPKTSVPGWSSLSGKPVVVPGEKQAPADKATPPPLPAKRSEPIQATRNEPKKPGAQHIPPIKLNEPSSDAKSSEESIFPEASQPGPAPKPAGWRNLEPGELNPPEGSLQSLEVFARSQRLLDKGAPATPSPEAKDKASPLVAPPLRPPSRARTPASAEGAGEPLRPPPLPLPQAKPAESSSSGTPPLPLQVAPPMVGKAPEVPSEKLSQPNLPADARKGETSTDRVESPLVPKVPASAKPEEPPAKPVQPPAPPVIKRAGNWFKKKWLKKSTPLVVSSTSKGPLPKVGETKPALKPAILPKRLVPLPGEPEVEAPQPAAPSTGPKEAAGKKEAAEKKDATASAVQPPELTLPAKPPEMETPPPADKEKAAPAAIVPPVVPAPPKAKEPLPQTRAARAKKRRFTETLIFWAAIVPITVVALFFGALHFGEETRVEGQVIPPPGMTLNNEVWIVSDFRELASGIAEDLAAERTPLLQEIQERRDHVQRAQADVASREERIRLIQEEIQAAKDEVAGVVKQSRDATQQIWDGEGARIDGEYQARLGELKKTIADRAKSLNLKYQTDDTYQSPEVWANAYRLALYEVPAGVDSVKEHQWLGDLMKQWRDFLKTLDDRKEQLREKAAQLKLAPGPKITDLNTKIDGLQQRIDGAAAEEVPLKAELQQAQADLALVQTEDANLDDKYYKQLDTLPGEAITKHIPLAANGRFSWVDDDVFAEGETEHYYWIFARATRSDGRQYWALHHFSIRQNKSVEMYIEPGGFISTKAILRPNLSPDEQEQ